MARTTTSGLVTMIALAVAPLGACGPPADHTATLTRLRDAIHHPITTTEEMEDHNQLVENVVQSGALEGLRTFEVEERIGQGEECGVRQICAEQGFRPTDWYYDVGRQGADPQLPAGPTLIVGFGPSGICDRAYYVTRR